MKKIFQYFIIGFSIYLTSSNISAITIDSSSGFDSSYPAENTIDGIYGNNNMGFPRFSPAWVIYDMGENPQTIRKFRITPPLYGGTPPATFNPTSGTIEFSNDKVTWTSAINWTMPQLESICRTDYSEIALPSPMTYRYVRMNFSWGRISEIFFITAPQLAVWEMAQDTTYSNAYPAIMTCDEDVSSFAASVNSEGNVIYDQGSSRYFSGFVLTSRNSGTSYNPTSGSVYMSDDPSAVNWTLVGNWTMPSLTYGDKGVVTFSASQALTMRYIKLVNASGGSQWAEFECLFPIVNTNTAKTAIIIPDGITISNPDDFVYSDIPVLFAAKELRYHIKKVTQGNAVLGIYNESQKPSSFTNFIYLGDCDATQKAGLSSDSLDNSEAIISCEDGNLFILGDDTAERTLGSGDSSTTKHYFLSNSTRVGTLLGVYDFLDEQLGVRWLWPGETGEFIPVKSDIIITPYSKNVIPKLLHSRFRDYSYASPSSAWSSQSNFDAFMDDQQHWLRRHGFVRNVSMDYGHSFTNWWNLYSTSHPEYFNLLPNNTRAIAPYYSNGDATVVSMCLSNSGLHSQKVTDWLNTRTAFKPWVQAAENDTCIKCTCSSCMALDVWNSSEMTLSEWNNRLSNATVEFYASITGWESKLGSMSDRFAQYLLAIQYEAESRDNNNPTNVVGYAYMNYRKPPVSTQLNSRIVIGYVPEFIFPWSSNSRSQVVSEMSGWMESGASIYLRPNYMFAGHNYPIYFAHKLGADFSTIYSDGLMIATDYDMNTGQYGVQALNLYMVARMNTQVGDMDQDSICEEFYSAFGPAENAVRNYFNYLKSISDALPATPEYNFWDFYIKGDYIFTSTVRTNMRTYMNAAITAAAGDADASAKVEFLNKGLIHAEKTLAAAHAWSGWVVNGDNPEDFNDCIEELDTFRGQNETHNISNFHFLRQMEDRQWNPLNRNSANGYNILPYTYTISCGNMYILHGDWLSATGSPSNCFFCWNFYDSDINLVLDLGSVTSVDKITNTNRTDVASNYNIKNIQIYVASDESSPSFNQYDQASYTQQIFNGIPNPISNTAGAVRTADISNVQRRYFLVKVISTFWGNITTDGVNTRYIYSDDFDIVEY